MSAYIQETDYKNSPEYLFPIKSVNETIGRKAFSLFSPSEMEIVKPVLVIIEKNQNPEVVNSARSLIRQIQEVILSLKSPLFDLEYLPSMRAFIDEDSSIVIEWIFANFRVGFTIELDSNESGWYLIAKRELGEINASGYINNEYFKTTLSWILGFIVSYA